MLIPTGNRAPPAIETTTSTPTGWRVGDIAIDLRKARVTMHGHVVELDRSGHALLLHLVEHAGTVVGKDDLLRVGWPGRVVSENSLAKAISKLRHALGDDSAELIRVVHGYGYRLNGVVTPWSEVPGRRVPEADSSTSDQMPSPLRERSRRPSALLVLGLVLATTALVVFGGYRTTVAPDPEAIAGNDRILILPFRDQSTDRSLGLHADGLANRLRNDMRPVVGLHMVGGEDSTRVRSGASDVVNVAHSLGANLLITGTVSSQREFLVVDLEMRDLKREIAPLQQRFQRPQSELAALHDDLAGAVIGFLLSEPERWHPDVRPGHGTAKPEAYLAFLRAAALHDGDAAGQRRAIAALEHALELDPEYADAWFALAAILGHNGYYADNGEELVKGRERALTAMDRGIALAPNNPNRYLERSEARHIFRHDWAGAAADLDAAAALMPSESAHLLLQRARLSAALGKLDEAIAYNERAIALDPQVGSRRNQGWHYIALGDTRRAREVLMLELKNLPDNPHVTFYLALCDIYEGMPEAALRRLEYSSTVFRLLGTAIARHDMGDHAAARGALDTLIARAPDAAAYQIAEGYAWLGDADAAFHWLDHAIAVGDAGVMYLKFDPLMRNLRDDPRYRAWLERLKLPLD